ncbi:hypothetical protein [Sandaracinus amylolyticus]|uniref:hypothetical protein n=1 Tax=Sandaracinus amylolyticus TaxID=927083 RepID=UPI001F1FAA16|nr:hypothetical protein [Sandaracinus amylolyticus]UJR84225.1 Hypothetical protein I5071_62970 [Sandaracinus amylolyticus]
MLATTWLRAALLSGCWPPSGRCPSAIERYQPSAEQFAALADGTLACHDLCDADRLDEVRRETLAMLVDDARSAPVLEATLGIPNVERTIDLARSLA